MGISFFLRKPKDGRVLERNLRNLSSFDKDSMFLTLFDTLPKFDSDDDFTIIALDDDDNF